MDMETHIKFLKELSVTLEKEVNIEEAILKEESRKLNARGLKLQDAKERLFHIQAAVNNLQAIEDADKEAVRADEDPWG